VSPHTSARFDFSAPSCPPPFAETLTGEAPINFFPGYLDESGQTGFFVGRAPPCRDASTADSALWRADSSDTVPRMSRHVGLVAALVLLAACSRSEPEAGAAKPTAGTFKVALLSPGPVSDAGWNALAYEGLLAIRDELGAEIAQIQTKTPAEFEAGFRSFAQRGFNLVFGHGFEFQDAAAAVAPDFPKTVFITTSGNTVRPNVAPLRFMLEEATYLEGMLTAMMSKTGKAGAVGGMAIPSVKSTILAYEAGARAVNPNFTVVTSYVGNWEDVGAAKAASQALIQQGADVLFHNADAAGLGVFQAAQEKKVWAFGANKNQNDIAPDVILASAVIDIPRAFVTVARQVKDGTFVAKIEKLGMKDGVIALVYNPALASRIPPDARARLEATQAEIFSGKLVVPSAEF
jgi:basic membrane lipoprotein Med (substrate-binding protein (PBP1-ABC) superfamily)